MVVVVVVVVGLRDGCQGAGWASQSGHLIDVYHWDSHSEMGGGGTLDSEMVKGDKKTKALSVFL